MYYQGTNSISIVSWSIAPITDTDSNGITDQADDATTVSGHEVGIDIGDIPVSNLQAQDDIHAIKQGL